MAYSRSDISRTAAIAVLVAIVLVGALLRLPGLTDPFGSSIDGWTGAFYSCMARNCVELSTPVPYLNPSPVGDRLIPYVNHSPSVPWLVATLFFLMGESEFAARLPFLTCSVVALVYAYRLGCRLGSRVSGLTAALCLATTPAAVVFGSQVEHVGSHALLAVLGLTLAHCDFYAMPNPKTGIRLGFWTVFGVWTDWPLLFLMIVLQIQAWFSYRTMRHAVIAESLFSGLCVVGLSSWLMSLDPRFGVAHFCEKVYQRTFRLVTDSSGVADGWSFSYTDLLFRYLWQQAHLFGLALVFPAICWLVIAFGDVRKQAIPIVLCGFSAVFYAVGAQGHFQHDYWSHPVAATYALVVAAALQYLRVGTAQTLWLAILIASANVSAIDQYRSTVLPRLSGPEIADEHYLLKRLVQDLPPENPLLVVDASQWPTLPYYLGRDYQSTADLAELIPVVRGERSSTPWQQYLFTHKIVAHSARHLVTNDEQLLPKPRWVIMAKDASSQLQTNATRISGQWRLYDLAAQTPSDDRGLNKTDLSQVDALQSADHLFGRGKAPSHSTTVAAPSEKPKRHWLSHTFNLVESFPILATLAVLSIGLLFRLPLERTVLRTVTTTLTHLSKRTWIPPCMSGGAAVLFAMAMTVCSGVPVPYVHDEMAYLLTADTFCHGRLANPTHPLWPHFESNHVFHSPVYQAKYPPAQGLFLAVGTGLFGHPIAGVWLSLGFGVAAVCWALQGGLPGRWAIVGGLLPALNPLIAFRWGNTYWGGAVAMLGGALVYGGVVRLLKWPQWPAATATAAGLALLANSRPVEGLIVSFPAVLLVIRSVGFRRDLTLQSKWRQILLPMAVVLMPVGVFMVQYNWHLTGSPVRMPYQHYEHKYAIAPSFLWQSMRPAPTYRSESIRRVHAEWECESYLEQKKSWLAFAQWCLWKEQILWGFFVGPILTLPLVALPAALFDRRVKLAVGILCLLLAVFVGHTFMQAHYAAPATILLIAVTVQSMRSLRTWQWRGYPAGRFLVRGTFLIWCTAPFLALWSHHAYFSRFNDSDRLQNCFHFRTEANPGDYLVASAVWRRQLVRELESRGGRHLVIVSYGPTNEPLFEWVYNEADIDAATVVWAHDLGQKANTQLTQYFRERHLWTLQINHRAVPRLIRIRAQSPDASLVKLGDRTVSLNNGQKGIP